MNTHTDTQGMFHFYGFSKSPHLCEHILRIYTQFKLKVGLKGYDMTWRKLHPVSPLDKRYYNVYMVYIKNTFLIHA